MHHVGYRSISARPVQFFNKFHIIFNSLKKKMAIKSRALHGSKKVLTTLMNKINYASSGLIAR